MALFSICFLLMISILSSSVNGSSLLSIYQQKIVPGTYQVVLLSDVPLAWKIQEKADQYLAIFLSGTNKINDKAVENISPLKLETYCIEKGCYLYFTFPNSVSLEKIRYLHPYALGIKYTCSNIK